MPKINLLNSKLVPTKLKPTKDDSLPDAGQPDPPPMQFAAMSRPGTEGGTQG
ncbi:hypothetical protein [Terriglobus roseus]|uniref:hypothetical protein n=1 Tax=Terriglobus roseus TaxID=392734 RepID=UPI001BAE7B3F|nr:hypothetical protein [Terriglobus roseus]